MDTKFVLASWTIWGIIATIAGFAIEHQSDLVSLFGEEWAPTISKVVIGAGLFLTLIGRFKADKKLTLAIKPRKASK